MITATTPKSISHLDQAKADQTEAIRDYNEKIKQLTESTAGASSREPLEYIQTIEGDIAELLHALRTWRTCEKRIEALKKSAAGRAAERAAKLRAEADKLDGGVW